MAGLQFDTTVLIDVLRERPVAARVRDLLTGGMVLGTSAISVEEVVRGLREAEEERARSLFDGLRIWPTGRREAEVAGRWRGSYARRGRTLAQPDCLIAATALARDATLCTGNVRDFPMPGLRVEHWPAGE